MHLVRVPLPILGTVDTQVLRQIDQWRSGQKIDPSNPRPLLILEFAGEAGETGGGSQFERCLSLARELSGERLQGVQCAAFLPRGVVGHAVLPVLACQQIILGEEAWFGEAGRDESVIDDTLRQAYTDIAERKRTVPTAIALAMLDKKQAVSRVSTTAGTRYVLEAELPALQQKEAVSQVEQLSRAGDLARFTGRDLRLKLSIASHLAADRPTLAAALGLPLSALQEDPTHTGEWQALRVELRGPIHGQQVTFIERTLRRHLAEGGCNFLCIVLDSAGGSPSDAWRLSQFLLSNEMKPVRTVALIPVQARGSAGLVALACDHIWVAPDAVLGGDGDDEPSLRVREGLIESLRSPELELPREWSLFAAMIEPEVPVHQYVRQGTGEMRFMREAEAAQLADPDAWTRGAALPLKDGLVGSRLVEIKLANGEAATLEDVRAYYHVEGELPAIEPNWAHLLIERLAHPAVAGFLLFVGIVTLFVEFSQPGVGVPGFISAVCFILYFWSHVLHGTAGWLEILLFIAGVVSVLIELFVLPGGFVFGLGGGLLIVASIVLASQTFVIPRNAYQLGQLPSSLGTLGVVGIGAFATLVMLRKYLPEAPVLKEMVLAPPDEEEQQEQDERESLVQLDFLIGKRGRATTPLLPSGKAAFGDEIVNVTTDGQPVADGALVVVVAARGNYLLVQPVEELE